MCRSKQNAKTTDYDVTVKKNPKKRCAVTSNGVPPFPRLLNTTALKIKIIFK